MGTLASDAGKSCHPSFYRHYSIALLWALLEMLCCFRSRVHPVLSLSLYLCVSVCVGESSSEHLIVMFHNSTALSIWIWIPVRKYCGKWDQQMFQPIWHPDGPLNLPFLSKPHISNDQLLLPTFVIIWAIKKLWLPVTTFSSLQEAHSAWQNRYLSFIVHNSTNNDGYHLSSNRPLQVHFSD